MARIPYTGADPADPPIPAFALSIVDAFARDPAVLEVVVTARRDYIVYRDDTDDVEPAVINATLASVIADRAVLEAGGLAIAVEDGLMRVRRSSARS